MMILNQGRNEIVNLDSTASVYIRKTSREKTEKITNEALKPEYRESDFLYIEFFAPEYDICVAQSFDTYDDSETIAVYFSKNEATNAFTEIIEAIGNKDALFIMPKAIAEPVYEREDDE